MKRQWFPRWVIPVLLLFTLGTVWLRLSIVNTSYAIHESNLTIRQLRKQKEQQELRVTQLRSPRRLEGLARTQFGLSAPKAEQRIVLRVEQ